MSSRATKYVFIDESEGKIGGRTYHTAIATVWRTSSLKPFRLNLLKAVSKLVNPSNTIKPLPDLHGSNMAPGYSDEVKLGCYSAVSSLLPKYGVEVYRLGYFDKVPLIGTAFDSLSFAINEICHLVGRGESGNFIFIYELNSAKHDKIAINYNDTFNHYVAAKLGYEGMTIPNFKNTIGRFYCDKKNVYMSATDIAGYYLLQLEKRNSSNLRNAFAKKSFEAMRPIGCCIKYNEIIQIK